MVASTKGCISNDPMGLDLDVEWVNGGDTDPNGLSPQDAGAKLDYGKVRPELVFRGFARALREVAEVATFGANKYCDDGWEEVPEGRQRYTDAMFRHYLKTCTGEAVDEESTLLHDAHLAWNALARLELFLREQENT